MSIRAGIVTAIVTALNTGAPTGMPVAEKSVVLPEAGPESIGVRRFREVVSPRGRPGIPLVQRAFQVRIDVRSSGTSSVAPDDRADEILEWITAALGGSRLGGLAQETLETEIRWDLGHLDVAYCLVPVLVTVSYSTKVNDATVRA